MKDATSFPPIKDALTLALFALGVGLTLWSIQRFTMEAISANEHKALRKNIETVLHGNEYDNNPVATQRALVDDKGTSRITYRAFNNNQPSAVAITAMAPDGYAGNIDLLVGVTYQGTISGVRALSHRETPGLGDKIDANKSQWIVEFNGLNLSQSRNWKVRKDGGDFDQFTGATITPRAVVRAVRQTLEWYSNNRREIFE